MSTSFILRHESYELVGILFLVMLFLVTLGRFTGKRLFSAQEKHDNMLSSVFAILGLMLAFTFGMSLNRFEKRIDNLIEESNDIGTAILRADLYPEEYRQLFRADFKEYVEARIGYFEAGADTGKILEMKQKGEAIAQTIWNRASQLTSNPAVVTVASMQMIPAINNMIDIANSRFYIALNKVPEPVLYLLFILICICAFLLGYTDSGKGKVDWLGILGVLLLVCAVVYLVIDIDRPRRGLITLKETNQSIIDLRKMFE